MSRWYREIKPTKEEQFWMYVCVIGAGLGWYLVAGMGIPQGLILGYVCVWNFGAYVQKHYGKKPRKKPQPSDDWRAIHWREQYIRLRGWDHMTEGQRHLFSKEITSSAMGMQGAAMKKELKELRAKYPDHKAFADLD